MKPEASVACRMLFPWKNSQSSLALIIQKHCRIDQSEPSISNNQCHNVPYCVVVDSELGKLKLF